MAGALTRQDLTTNRAQLSRAMHRKVIYRIYTEEKNKRVIVRLTAKNSENFTLQPTLGYYRGKPERSIVIEILGASQRAVEQLAVSIRRMNGQKSILVMKVQAQGKLTRRKDDKSVLR